MRKLTWTTEEKQEYLANQLKHYYGDLVSLYELGFEGSYNTQIECNSKYYLDVIIKGTNTNAYNTYELGLILYKKENNVVQHSLRLALDNPKMFRGVVYHGYSTPCFRGKLQTNQLVQFMCDYSDLSDSRKLVIKGIHKEGVLSAYFEGATSVNDFIIKVKTQVKFPYLKVEGLN